MRMPGKANMDKSTFVNVDNEKQDKTPFHENKANQETLETLKQQVKESQEQNNQSQEK